MTRFMWDSRLRLSRKVAGVDREVTLRRNGELSAYNCVSLVEAEPCTATIAEK